MVNKNCLLGYLLICSSWRACVCVCDAGNRQVPSDLHGVNEYGPSTGTDSLQPTHHRRAQKSTQPDKSHSGYLLTCITP